ncbi:MAG: epimerase, partial [Enterovirga sp.]|nr:epimerase [Enterovirga sp.]
MIPGPGGLPLADLDEAVARAAPALRALDGASLFVTGGTGFFGRWLLAVLARGRERLDLGPEVTLLSRRPDAFAAAHPDLAGLGFLRLVAGDVQTFAFPPGGFSHVVHAATDTGVAADDDPAALTSSIVEGTRRVLAFARGCGTGRLLFVSSGAAYGPQPPELALMPESHPGAPDPRDPRSAYGVAKRVAEDLCREAAATGGPQPVIARAFAFVGPGLPLDGHFAIGNFVRDAVCGREITVSGDGSPLRSYLYAGDLAVWLLALLARGAPGGLYNVGSDRAIGIGDLARLVGAVVPGAGDVSVRGELDRNAARNRYVPSIDRARRELGLDVWTPLEEAIRR